MLIRRSLVALLVIAVGYAALLPFTELPGFIRGSQWELNVMAAEQYVYERPDAPVVVVGSSISYWLKDLPEDWFNLALAGEGCLTGLDIIERSEARPQTVLVEINVAERSPNAGLVDGLLMPGLRQAKRSTPALRERNEPAHVTFRCLYLGSYYAGRVFEKIGLVDEVADRDTRPLKGLALVRNESPTPQAEGAVASTKSETSEPAEPGAGGGGVLREVRLQAVQTRYDPVVLTARLQDIRQRVESLEARGVRVILFEAPEDAATYDSPRRSQLRELARQVLPPDRFAYMPRPTNQSFHTRDGTHMTAESAERYCRWLFDHVPTKESLASSASLHSIGATAGR